MKKVSIKMTNCYGIKQLEYCKHRKQKNLMLELHGAVI